MLRRALGSVSRAASLQHGPQQSLLRQLPCGLAVATGSLEGVFARGQSSAAQPAVTEGKEGSVPPTPTHMVDGKEVPYIPEFTGKWNDEWLERLRNSNTSLPLRGQVIIGKIIHVDKRSVLVDTGYKVHQRFMKRELSPQSLVARADGSEADLDLDGSGDFRVGDELHLVVRNPSTPYGDMQLEVQRYKTDAQLQAVLEELRSAHQSGRMVMGRVLNAVNGGYAVGVAGLVVFLPSSRASLNTVKKLGVLHPFFVLSIDERNGPNVVVGDPYPKPRTRRVIRGKLL